MKKIIMVIEDNIEMANLISIFLENESFHTVQFETAEKALDFLKNNTIDIILLDINLPGMDGFTFLNHARRITNVPVLIVTARRTETDVITGLGFGADDFVTKPFSSGILVARIRALLRRSDGLSGFNEKKIIFGPFVFLPDTFSLEKNGDQVPLSNRECKLFHYLVSNADKYMTPEVIYNDVWKNKFGDLTIVAVYIQRLRRKIEDIPSAPVYIRTLFGRGYGFHFPDQEGTKEQ